MSNVVNLSIKKSPKVSERNDGEENKCLQDFIAYTCNEHSYTNTSQILRIHFCHVPPSKIHNNHEPQSVCPTKWGPHFMAIFFLSV